MGKQATWKECGLEQAYKGATNYLRLKEGRELKNICMCFFFAMSASSFVCYPPPPHTTHTVSATPASSSLLLGRCKVVQQPFRFRAAAEDNAAELTCERHAARFQSTRPRGAVECRNVVAVVTEGGGSWKDQIGKTLRNAMLVATLSLSVSLCGYGFAEARPEGVNRPELLPKKFTPLIDVAGFLSEGQENRIIKELRRLEEDTGFKLRVLAQNYPNTPGLAVKDFWQVDDSTIVFVADPTMGNILNFNVGAAVDLNVPRSFWSRLAGTYGNIFYWREKGEDSSIEAAVSAIGSCLRELQGPYACSDIK
ncbi:hypothetical protein O6H91_03G029900 [Diphasiastrum complanatum]|uniref:Uncharacterized protein n=1 Tax=Diphasiastrum complanatum TaxID=34168 RepID=A0ACC2E529_DIPCM|nr:hypothetical protein O6H91_03G029900 [Diphasiastrum complanatum]